MLSSLSFYYARNLLGLEDARVTAVLVEAVRCGEKRGVGVSGGACGQQ
jgi:hypothetical protein